MDQKLYVYREDPLLDPVSHPDESWKLVILSTRGLMGCRNIDRPWAVVAADLLEFPPSKNQFKYVVVFMDLFTRWVELKPLRKADGKSVVFAFEDLILNRWKVPDYFLCDNGKEFDNKEV